MKTKKHNATEWRHDMWPSVHLPSVSCSGTDSKLGLTVAKADPPPVSKRDASFLWFLTFPLKIGTPLAYAVGNFCASSNFLVFFCF